MSLTVFLFQLHFALHLVPASISLKGVDSLYEFLPQNVEQAEGRGKRTPFTPATRVSARSLSHLSL